ncbi:MAG: hypothetical protein L6V93_17305 [Clostridiales bacterium]|nr:MAG: hypothetical protein L6V93_17305 [Clostridiales bacterium]
MCDENADFPAVICVDRINTLRFSAYRTKSRRTLKFCPRPTLVSTLKKCGLKKLAHTGCKKSFQNEIGTRKCKFVTPR